ncbi:MAG TPA: ATP-binding protein, partial [Thermoanaerobaculia bacterium]|nr:ATP-binding protein [Thermoanaerobaculia bacterium]
MRTIRAMSIAAKLRMLMMATAATALLLACGAFAFVDFRTFHSILVQDSETLADVVAFNSAAPLMFNDREAAKEILAALKAKRPIVGAAIFDKSGTPFAWYDAEGGEEFRPHRLDVMKRSPRTGEVEIYRPIAIDGQHLGTLYIVTDDHVSVARAKRYAIAAGAILVLSLFVAFLLSSGLQSLISAPITELARVANEVTHSRNYAARVELAHEPQNEIGKLIVGFNQMLAEIERRDEQLQRHRDELEGQIALRTSELISANIQLRAARDAAELAAEAHADLGRRKQLILNSAAEGIFGLDSAGVVTFINRSAARILDWPVEEIAGKRLHDFIQPPDAHGETLTACAICSDSIEPAVRVGKRGSFVKRDGTEIPIEYTASTMLDPSSRPSGVVVTFRDITERLVVDRMKDEFVSTVSHELRTPLTSIRGALGLLASGLIGNIGERAQKMLDIAVTNTDRLVRLINDILDLERIDSGRVELNRATCDASDLMTSAVDVMQAFADRAGVEIEIEQIHESLWVDPDRIIQTLTNLLSNAVKFSPRDASVRVSAERDGEFFTFIVEDHGRGIPTSHLESVFERFKQVDSSDSRNKNGTGLGLAICRSIVNAHGGRIWAESVEGKGTTFRFSIPLQPACTMVAERRRKVIVCGEESLRAALDRRGFEVVACPSIDKLQHIVAETHANAILIDVVGDRDLDVLNDMIGDEVPIIVVAANE